MKIEIWSIGKASDAYINEGINNYFNKIKPYCPISLEIFQTKKTYSDPIVQKQQEEEMILKKLQPQHTLVLLDEKGKILNSPQVAQLIQDKMNHSSKILVFLIGGAFGVTDTVYAKAQNVWSLSNLVFPHQLVRLMLSEQIYRAYAILNNLPYHHA